MMTPDEKERFDRLREGPCVSPQYIKEYYGLPWPFEDELKQDFERWSTKVHRKNQCSEDSVSRYELESFMTQGRLVPLTWMAARLGMVPDSLRELLLHLHELGMRPQRYQVYAELISDSLSEDLVPALPGLKFRTFSDQNSFCSRLHSDLESTLGLKIQPLYCATSTRLKEYERQFASHFDCITLEPLSVKHQVWLDFRKPLNLGPDRTSKLFYVENRKVLRPYSAGSAEPEDLERYKEFIAAHAHA
jgi:hypothetical protein